MAFIAAVEINTQIIGHSDGLAWHIAEDMRFFKNKTMKHAVIMGRKTYASIGRPLPQRYSIVLTSDTRPQKRFLACNDIESALSAGAKYTHKKNLKPAIMFCIGGGEIYSQLMPHADKLYITEVDMPNVEGDVFFPVIDERQWHKTIIDDWRKTEKGDLSYRFVEYDKVNP